MKAFYLLFSILFSFYTVNAQKSNISIKGEALNYEYLEISAFATLDYISNTQKKLTYTTIDSSGNFLLEWNTKEIQYITLKIENHIANMYVEPNSNYEIKILPPDSTTYQNPNIEHHVKISIKLKSKTEINALTLDYDNRFDNFLTVEYPSFVNRTALPKIDSFKIAMQNFYSTVKNPYFYNYIDYSVATLEEKARKSEKQLYEKYFLNKPILYNQLEYMNLFNTFYKLKLQSIVTEKGGGDLAYHINDRGSFVSTKKFIKKFDYLQNDTICELALIKGLYESYYDNNFEKKSIIPMLEQALIETKVNEHKLIIQNILNSFSKLQKGTLAPFFELPDKEGKTHSLDELRANKYVYVTMFDSKCSSCMQQLKVLPYYKKQYGNMIEFVSISLDPTNADLKNFVAQNPKYNWHLLYDNSLGKLKKEYEIKSLPAYFLIAPDGKFVQVPADGPEQDIERLFYDIVKPKAKIHGIGNKKN